jgi:hypothetical protein
MRTYNESLVERLHDLSVNCGEIIAAEHAAQIIQEFEFEHGFEFTPETILASIREAADRTCESYIGNAYDSRSEWGEEQFKEEVEKWEAQRPAKVREAKIKALLTPPKVIYTHSGSDSYQDGTEWVKRLPAGVWLSPGQSIAIVESQA